VEVNGTRDLARQIAVDLERRGVAATASAGCPLVAAAVTREGELVHVEVTDEFGRSRTWDVRDVTTAAALIESWTKQEADEIDLGPAPAKAPSASASNVVAMIAPADELGVAETMARAPARPTETRGGLSVAFESATDGNAAWYGGALGGCVRLAMVCAGGRLRGGRSTPPHHDLTAVDLLATVELPLPVRGFLIAPGAAVGVGWTRATTDDPHAAAPSQDVGGVRAGVQLVIARPIGRAISAELLFGFDGAIMGQGDAPTVLSRSLGRLGIGLRYGGR